MLIRIGERYLDCRDGRQPGKAIRFCASCAPDQRERMRSIDETDKAQRDHEDCMEGAEGPGWDAHKVWL